MILSYNRLCICVLLAVMLFGIASAQDLEYCPKPIVAVIDSTGHEFCPDHRLDLYGIYGTVIDSVLVMRGETSNAAAYDSVLARVKRLSEMPVRNEMVLLPESKLGDKIVGVVTISTGLLRRHPSVTAEMVSQGIMGEEVKLLKKRDLFYFCKLSDGYLGWMMTSSIQRMNQTEIDQWRSLKKVIYLKNFGEIRSAKKDGALPIGDVVRGAILAEIKKEGKWRKVLLPDGRTGFLRKSDIADLVGFRASVKPTAKGLLRVAHEFTGFPYVWGGASTKGFDCSGFTKTVYKLNGIDLPRDANMQATVGKPVTIDPEHKNLQVGDLLFFGRSPDKITHVGMYIGNQRFIHSDGYVRINSFDPKDPEYSEHRDNGLQVARRFL